MGKIHVLPEYVANKIAAGEVVERPSSAVKELLENSLDAGARRIHVAVEAGGKKLIQVSDDGCGMVRDDALLAFERHATSKLKHADDLLAIATLGFRGEALPSIAAVSRLRLETRAAEEAGGSVIEIAGGQILRVDEAGLPVGTVVTVRDLFFNIPARRKFLKSEATELSHVASLVTHYALAHPDKHFELHSATHAMLVAPPVANHADRIYQILGKSTLNDLLPIAANLPLRYNWQSRKAGPNELDVAQETDDPLLDGTDDLSPPKAQTGGLSRATSFETDHRMPPVVPPSAEIRLHGFVSKPAIQKLNRNSIFVFVNRRLIRDRLVLHALTEAYRNLMPATVFPVVLLFLELPFSEVDVNVHPSKTEVRFRQQTLIHDFIRDSVRAGLVKARPVPQFVREITARATAMPALTPPPQPAQDQRTLGAPCSEAKAPDSNVQDELGVTLADAEFALRPLTLPVGNERLSFQGEPIPLEGNAALPVPRFPPQTFGGPVADARPLSAPGETAALGPAAHEELAMLRVLGQVQNSFIVAVGEDSLWVIDQHAAHERVLFEKVLRERAATQVESQRLLMPLIVQLTPAQQAVYAEIGVELGQNGFEIEPFGSRTIAVKIAPAGIEVSILETMLHELLDQLERERQTINLERVRCEIAASIACHAAIKINTPLEPHKMDWLLKALARTECPMSCPHGRPVVLRYSVKEIQRAFKRL
jgi:DNA mismatch repair protein MutL